VSRFIPQHSDLYRKVYGDAPARGAWLALNRAMKNKKFYILVPHFLAEWLEVGKQIAKTENSKNTVIDFFDDALAFAVVWTIEEAKAETVLWEKYGSDPRFMQLLLRRFTRWWQARLKFHGLRGEKLCPASNNPDHPAMAEAAFLGSMVSEQVLAGDSRIIQFMAKSPKIDPKVFRMFTRWAHAPVPSRWKERDMDCWLVCIWPLVEERRWNYAQVLRVAQKKFPKMLEHAKIKDPKGERFPLDVQTMATHCKRLGLRVQIKGGRPKKSGLRFSVQRGDAFLPYNWQLALRVSV